MYVKTTTRKTRTGEVRYLQLPHNEWDAAARRSVPKVVYSFGREDQLDTDAIRRLVTALSRLLSPAGALAATADGYLAFTESRPYGGAYVLDQLWHRLGIAKILAGLASSGRGRPRGAAAGRGLVGLVAHPALAPPSHLRRGGVDEPGRAHRPARRSHRRRVLPGDGLAAPGPRRPRKAGLLPGRGPAEPRSGSAVLRHHIDVLRGGGRRRGCCAGLAGRDDGQHG